MLDSHSGHGTFIAGLVRQICPDADIRAVRVMHANGVADEYELLRCLLGLAERVRRDRDGEEGGLRADVVVLSLGYRARDARGRRVRRVDAAGPARARGDGRGGRGRGRQQRVRRRGLPGRLRPAREGCREASGAGCRPRHQRGLAEPERHDRAVQQLRRLGALLRQGRGPGQHHAARAERRGAAVGRGAGRRRRHPQHARPRRLPRRLRRLERHQLRGAGDRGEDRQGDARARGIRRARPHRRAGGDGRARRRPPAPAAEGRRRASRGRTRRKDTP